MCACVLIDYRYKVIRMLGMCCTFPLERHPLINAKLHIIYMREISTD